MENTNPPKSFEAFVSVDIVEAMYDTRVCCRAQRLHSNFEYISGICNSAGKYSCCNRTKQVDQHIVITVSLGEQIFQRIVGSKFNCTVGCLPQESRPDTSNKQESKNLHEIIKNSQKTGKYIDCFQF